MFSKNFRLFAVMMAMTVFVVLPVLAQKKATPTKTTTPAASASGSVFTITSVSKAQNGKMPDFAWKNGAKAVNMSEMGKGKPIFVNFWATWCPPCRREIPDIISLSKELEGKVTFVGISLDHSSSPNPLKLVTDFVKKNNMGYLNLVGNDAIQNEYGGIESIPTTFIIDKNGKIAERIIGMRTKEDFLNALKKVM